MTATGHAVIGTVIAVVIPNPAVAIPLALASHVAADLFPHWDPGTNRDKKSYNKFFSGAFADVALSFILTFLIIYFIFPQTDIIYAYLVVFAAQFLDWLSAPYVFFKVKSPSIFYLVYKFQKTFDSRLDKPWGIIGQVAMLVILVAIATQF